MDELLAAIEQEHGYPPTMIERSARARAQADGVSVEDVLRAWAGGGPIEASGTPAPEPSAAEPAAAPAAAAAPEPAEPAGPQAEVLEPPAPAPAAAASVEPSPAPEPEEPESRSIIPTWMAAAFAVVPLFALLYAMWVPNGPDCGDSGQLAVDPVTGAAANCDGSPFGVIVASFLTDGEALYTAQACAGCHGAAGGGGTGPALAGGEVLATFPSCETHIEWVRLGSLGWPDPTYGATDKPVQGGMPAFPDLTDEEIASVILFERVAFGGQEIEEAEADCGLADSSETAAGE